MLRDTMERGASFSMTALSRMYVDQMVFALMETIATVVGVALATPEEPAQLPFLHVIQWIAADMVSV